MDSISSGIKDLDNLIDSFYVGDNVVWEVEAGTSPEIFVFNFIHQSLYEGQNVIYASFNRSPQTVMQHIREIQSEGNFILLDCFTSGKGKNEKAFTKFYDAAVHANVIRVDDPKNLEEITSILTSLEDSFKSGGRYVFDSLTGMQDLWGDENKTYKFFTYLCPLLYDLGTVAYWILEKDAHSQKFKANLRHITQVVLELYKRKDKLWIKALKLENRPNRDAFKPHSYEIAGKTISITFIKKEPVFDVGTKIKELRTRNNMSQKELADKINLTPSYISQLENNQITPSLNSFLQICNALGVSLSDTIEKKSEEVPWLIKKEKVFFQPLINERGFRIYSIINNESLSCGIVVIEPFTGVKGDVITQQGKRLMYVLKGDISVVVDGQIKTLRTGDSAYLEKKITTRLKNEGGDVAEILFLGIE